MLSIPIQLGPGVQQLIEKVSKKFILCKVVTNILMLCEGFLLQV